MGETQFCFNKVHGRNGVFSPLWCINVFSRCYLYRNFLSVRGSSYTNPKLFFLQKTISVVSVPSLFFLAIIIFVKYINSTTVQNNCNKQKADKFQTVFHFLFPFKISAVLFVSAVAPDLFSNISLPIMSPSMLFGSFWGCSVKSAVSQIQIYFNFLMPASAKLHYFEHRLSVCGHYL